MLASIFFISLIKEGTIGAEEIFVNSFNLFISTWFTFSLFLNLLAAITETSKLLFPIPSASNLT